MYQGPKNQLAQSMLPQQSSLESQHNIEQFKNFAALLVQFYQELRDLANPRPIRPTRLMVRDLLHVCEAADGIQDLARRLHPGFKADQQQDAAEFADFLSAVLDVCVRLVSEPNIPVGQILYPALRQVQCECGYYIYISYEPRWDGE